MEEAWEILLLLLFSGTKFFLAPAAALLAGFDLKTTILICGVGGTLGFFFFYYFAVFINRTWSKLFTKKKKVFSRKNKLIVKVRSSFGMIGVAALTPCLLSIPIGSILAANYYRDNKATIPIFILCIWFWAVAISCTIVYFKH